MELACALYARGRITKVSAAQLAGASLSEFQRALGERQIESYTHEMLDDDIQAMRELFAQ